MKSCYLDNCATTRPFDEVIAAMADAMAQWYHNPSAAYGPGAAVEDRIASVRAGLLQALGGQGSVVFVSGGTEADNLAVLGAVRKGSAVVTTAAEHPAVAMAIEEVKAQGGDVITLPVDATGNVSAENLAGAVRDGAALVSIHHVNNETGAVQDIAALAALAKQINPGVLFHSDGVQAFLRVAALPGRWGVDLYGVSAHKVHGPKGIGALYVGREPRLHPRMLGGGQEGGLRSGTENVPGIVGFGKAVEVFLQGHGQRVAALMEMKLALAERLLAIEGAMVNGPPPALGAPHILNVSFHGVQGEVLLRSLGEKGIYVSTGSACGVRRKKHSAVLQAMGLGNARIESAVRLSLSPMNVMADVELAGDEIAAQVKRLRAFKRR